MYVPVVKDAIVYAECVDMRLYIFESDDSRLLHHVAKIAGKRQLARLALAERCLDEEDFAAHTCPSQARNDTCIAVALVDVAVERRLAEQSFNLVRRNLLVYVAVERLLVSNLAQSLVHLLFQLAHAAFTSVLLNDSLDCSLCECRLLLVLVKSAVLYLARNEMTFCYLYLLLCDVAAHLDKLHTVEQRTRYGVEVVGGCNEEHL